MKTLPRSGPSARLVAVLLALVMLAAACGSSTRDENATSASTASVTINHKFGATTISGTPERVVTIGFNEQDFAIALGTEPIGVREFLGYDAPQRPWIPESIRGRQIPTVGSQDLNFEKIATLAPDLILGVNSYIDAEDYAKLADIAPTVAQSDQFEDGGTPWDEQTKVTGQALGKQADADRLVSEVRDRFDQVRSSHPEFDGKTASFLLGTGGASAYALGQSDYRTGWLSELGFTVQAKNSSISAERLDVVDTDVLMAEGLGERLAQSKVFTALAAVRENRFIDFGGYDQDFAAALGFNSPLSLPFVLEIAEPRLAAATDDDPATAPQPYPPG